MHIFRRWDSVGCTMRNSRCARSTCGLCRWQAGKRALRHVLCRPWQASNCYVRKRAARNRVALSPHEVPVGSGRKQRMYRSVCTRMARPNGRCPGAILQTSLAGPTAQPTVRVGLARPGAPPRLDNGRQFP
eukprot:2313731-Alexandrium_andersonii.AAC.1